MASFPPGAVEYGFCRLPCQMSSFVDSCTELSLACHPQTPCTRVQRIGVAVRLILPRVLVLRYRIDGDIARLRLPTPQAPAPPDRLWAHTCCELFVAQRGGAIYREWNFSPSGQFVQYDFRAYRVRDDAGETSAPALRIEHHEHHEHALSIEARIAVPAALGDALQIGLSAVIEDAQGTITYWALCHPPGKPDFHHRDAFALALDLATCS